MHLTTDPHRQYWIFLPATLVVFLPPTLVVVLLPATLVVFLPATLVFLPSTVLALLTVPHAAQLDSGWCVGFLPAMLVVFLPATMLPPALAPWGCLPDTLEVFLAPTLVVSPPTRLRHQFSAPEQKNLTLADLRAQTPTHDSNFLLADAFLPRLLMSPCDCG